MPISEEVLKTKHSEEYQELQRQLREKDFILETYNKEHGKLEVFFKHIGDVVRPVIKLSKAEIAIPKDVMSESPSIAVMQISDGHMGAVQYGEEIEYINEFNPEICSARQIDYAKRFVKWVDMHRASHNIRDCAVIVTGDLISGDIHENLQITNAFPTPVQCVKAAEVLTKQMAIISPHFENITVHFLVEDNHSRLTKKPQAKEAGYNSLNYIVGKIASIYLEKHDNIVFNIYPQYEKVIEVSTRKYLISHGHGLQGWMGVPWYSIDRHVGKEAKARLQIIMNDITRAKDIGFHKYIFGHWHTPFDHSLYSCCASVSGTDAYDHKNGRYSEPSQSSWIVHPKHGEFDRINFLFV
jgi:hypothetical protein